MSSGLMKEAFFDGSTLTVVAHNGESVDIYVRNMKFLSEGTIRYMNFDVVTPGGPKGTLMHMKEL